MSRSALLLLRDATLRSLSGVREVNRKCGFCAVIFRKTCSLISWYDRSTRGWFIASKFFCNGSGDSEFWEICVKMFSAQERLIAEVFCELMPIKLLSSLSEVAGWLLGWYQVNAPLVDLSVLARESRLFIWVAGASSQRLYFDASRSCWLVGDFVSRMPLNPKFLRKTKLDEIPQIINIIRGDMVFIGPRPESYEIANSNIEFYK